MIDEYTRSRAIYYGVILQILHGESEVRGLGERFSGVERLAC
jgi:hypothetical protein